MTDVSQARQLGEHDYDDRRLHREPCSASEYFAAMHASLGPVAHRPKRELNGGGLATDSPASRALALKQVAEWEAAQPPRATDRAPVYDETPTEGEQ